MLKNNISVILNKKVSFPFRKEWIKNISGKILRLLEITEPIELGVFITDDKDLKKLNKIHLGLNEPTDVLSFYMSSRIHDESDAFVLPPDGIRHLGEVIISFERAKSQAVSFGKTIEDEMKLLLVHSILHLLDYDHEKPEDARKMIKKEKEILIGLS